MEAANPAQNSAPHLTQIAGCASFATMPEPMPKIPEDPALRLALACEFLAILAAAKSDDDVTGWLKTNTPRLGDALAIAELAAEQCTPGSQWEVVNARATHIAQFLRAEFTKSENFTRAHGERDLFGAIRRIIYEMTESGDMPEDWETREGCKFSASRWMTEFFEAMGDKISASKEGDLGGERLALLRAYECIETAMDRVLTLPPEERAAYLPIVEPLYSGYMANRKKNLGE